MTLPDFQTFMLPLLRLASKEDVSTKSAVAPMAEELRLTPDDLAEPLPSGHSKIINRIHWALFYMFKAGLVERPSRGHYRATAEGLEALAGGPGHIDVKFLRGYERFNAFHPVPTKEAAPSGQATLGLWDDSPEESVTPDERLAEAQAALESALLSDIREQLLRISPTAFERLIVELMKGLNYGARGLARHVGGPGDGGLDGLVTEDILGLDSIYIQAKRYTDSTVAREEIQAFAGAMDGQSVTKGVFVTTSTFSKNAIGYADRSPKHLRLIDGEELARLMHEHGIGVRVHKKVEIKRLDLDFFNDLEE
ncbi:MAG: restriction endonuclease [Deltaproteobacteria bacterium]|jgi:restriction system protein|nr:restriction endonuclease [Deltaproteobacteria bacterium]